MPTGGLDSIGSSCKLPSMTRRNEERMVHDSVLLMPSKMLTTYGYFEDDAFRDSTLPARVMRDYFAVQECLLITHGFVSGPSWILISSVGQKGVDIGEDEASGIGHLLGLVGCRLLATTTKRP